MAPPKSDEIASGISKMSLKNTGKAKAKKAEPVADSWEDEDVSSESEPEAKPEEKKSKQDSKTSGAELESWEDDENNSGEERAPSPPPPRNRKPEPSTSTSVPPFLDFTGPGGASSTASSSEYKRPEKTDAVARRMIAGALGLKAPKLTEEQKAYDRALREKERKRKEEEREWKKRAEEEAAKAKAAIWDD